ncbi:hypothetical protein ABIC08_007690 [Bradyrhizobium sp. RT9b]|uniref:hypothetical protein n=1 Tax=unclassified Bradyrhizobium TaxID=2631580 RepID=UPI0033982406
MVALVTSIAAVGAARAVDVGGWLCGAALIAIIVMAVLARTVTAGRAGEVWVAPQYSGGDGYHGRRTWLGLPILLLIAAL